MARLRKDGGFDKRFQGGKLILILLLLGAWIFFDYVSDPNESFVCGLMIEYLKVCPDILAIIK